MLDEITSQKIYRYFEQGFNIDFGLSDSTVDVDAHEKYTRLAKIVILQIVFIWSDPPILYYIGCLHQSNSLY